MLDEAATAVKSSVVLLARQDCYTAKPPQMENKEVV